MLRWALKCSVRYGVSLPLVRFLKQCDIRKASSRVKQVQDLPIWSNTEKCNQCGLCVDTCAMEGLYAFKVSKKDADENKLQSIPLLEDKDGRFTIQVDPDVCEGCGECSFVCEDECLVLKSGEKVREREQMKWDKVTKCGKIMEFKFEIEE